MKANRHKHARPDMQRPAETVSLDPAELPEVYAMRISGECLAPAIQHGDAVLIDQREPYAPGDLVVIFFKPECVAPGDTNCRLKRLAFGIYPGITFPYEQHPESNVMPIVICEQDNPPLQYHISADKILAVHRCMGLVPDDVVLFQEDAEPVRLPKAAASASAGFSRRDLLAGTATMVPAAGLAAVPSLAAESLDARLERACHELDDVLREMHPEAFEGPWTEPEDPDAELVALGNEYDRLAAIEDRLNNRCWRIWREGWAEADHPFDPPRTEADVEKWKVAFNKFQDESGHAEASEELAAHDAIMDPIGKKIEAMTPTTLAGVIAKAKFVRMWLPVGCYRDSDHVPIVDAADVDDYGDQMLRQFIEELIALGGPVRSRAEGAS